MHVKNFDLVKKYLQDRVKSFQGGTLKFHLKQLKELTFDLEILTTLSGMHIETDNLPAVKLCQYPFSKREQEFVAAEIKTLLAKSVIVEIKHETRELI